MCPLCCVVFCCVPCALPCAAVRCAAVSPVLCALLLSPLCCVSGAQLLSLVANMEDTFARLEQQQSKVPPWLNCVGCSYCVLYAVRCVC
jgi:hypothetical protein